MKKEKTSNSFEFTSYWADANNRVLTDLIDLPGHSLQSTRS